MSDCDCADDWTCAEHRTGTIGGYTFLLNERDAYRRQFAELSATVGPLRARLTAARAEVERLRDALARIAGGAWPYNMMRIASDALKGEGE